MSKTRTSACSLLAALTTFGPASLNELARLAATSEKTASGWIASLRAAKLVHIGGWATDSRGYHTIALYAWNPGAADVPCPAKSGSQRVRDHRNRRALA